MNSSTTTDARNARLSPTERLLPSTGTRIPRKLNPTFNNMSRIKSSIASTTTYRWRYLPFAFLLLVQTSFGREVRVDSVEGFHGAIADAAPGDRIVVRDGTYLNTAPLKV